MAPVIIDFEKVCRLCLREDDGQCKMTSIYEQQDLEETIQKCVQVDVSINSDGPTNICASCMLSLDSWNKFKMLCDSTNAFLHQYIQDKNESDLMLNSEISNLGVLGFTPSQMSDVSIGFFENDSLWNTSFLQNWGEVDSPCIDLPVPRYTKNVHPPENLFNEDMSSEECLDIELNVLSTKNDNFTSTKTHWWNPKAISMKTLQKENEKTTLKIGISESMKKYDRYARKTYACNLCSEKFSKFNDLILHDSTVHIHIPKDFNCKICGKLFLSKERLEIHEKVHREKLFECQLCRKKFTLQKTLDKHLNIHIGLYTCRVCNYKAQTKYNLKEHENVHSLVKEHCCKECEQLFSTQSSLRRHNRLVHQKLISFRCDQCDYSTVHPSNLNHHKSIHTPQNFICDHCGLCFKTRELFMTHLKTHNDLLHGCTHCNKQFKKKSTLKEHLRNNHTSTPRIRKHKCDICEKYFSEFRYLCKHKDKFHPI